MVANHAGTIAVKINRAMKLHNGYMVYCVDTVRGMVALKKKICVTINRYMFPSCFESAEIRDIRVPFQCDNFAQ